ncbi:hypothetical protein KBC03_06410 [Patescibacteria group bacterium]|nr:hypothetical protein [Patescibacteria group bacterium]
MKIQKKSTPNGHLYEKVSAKEIQSALDQSAQVKSDLSRIQIDGKIDEIGEKLVKITYKGKSIKVPVTIM